MDIGRIEKMCLSMGWFEEHKGLTRLGRAMQMCARMLLLPGFASNGVLEPLREVLVGIGPLAFEARLALWHIWVEGTACMACFLVGCEWVALL